MFWHKPAISSTIQCSGCGVEHSRSALEERFYICQMCNRYLPMPSRARIELLADPGTFRELNPELFSLDPLKFMDLRPYQERLKEARRESGVREAITTGLCGIGGKAAVLMVFEFEFLGGTMGSVVGEKIANAFEEAIRRRLPVVTVTATGGARVQEGMLSLMQMAKVAAAASLHHREGLAFISILTDPTFGGVTASFASLGDVIIAEPGAQIGFVGPRVIEQTTGVPPPKDSHHAETLLRVGLIDLIVPRPDLRVLVGYLIAHLRQQDNKESIGERPLSAPKKTQLLAWQKVSIARHSARPTARHYISRMCTHFLELHGDRWGGDDRAIIGGLAELDGQTVVIVAHDRGATPEESAASHGGMAFPEGYRKALRLMQLAAKFGHSVITLVDCPNAQASYESEHRGIAHALANNLAGMSSLPTPIVSVIIGQGGSGGAVALAVADRVLMLEHAIYSVISPEGAASILYRDVARAEAVAEVLKLTAHDLLELGIIDVVVPEPVGGAHIDPDAAATTLKTHLLAALREARAVPSRRLLATRYERYRHIGYVGVHWRTLAGNVFRRAVGFMMPLLPRKDPGDQREPHVHRPGSCKPIEARRDDAAS
jgi:acetyl-CoA carboxylase carboxyl transferase alpha subunit/acetyl-CoA carboxylase carboxyl transferase beta subunit